MSLLCGWISNDSRYIGNLQGSVSYTSHANKDSIIVLYYVTPYKHSLIKEPLIGQATTEVKISGIIIILFTHGRSDYSSKTYIIKTH